jgi:hypothetical protein
MGQQQHKQRHGQQTAAQAAGGRVLRLGECTAAAFVQVILHLFASNVDGGGTSCACVFVGCVEVHR